MASCTLRMHLKRLLSINLVVLVVILLLDGENFLVHEEDVFVPVLGVPLEETFCSCPFEQRCAVMCRSSLMRHDLIGLICSAFGT